MGSLLARRDYESIDGYKASQPRCAVKGRTARCCGARVRPRNLSDALWWSLANPQAGWSGTYNRRDMSAPKSPATETRTATSSGIELPAAFDASSIAALDVTQ